MSRQTRHDPWSDGPLGPVSTSLPFCDTEEDLGSVEEGTSVTFLMVQSNRLVTLSKRGTYESPHRWALEEGGRGEGVGNPRDTGT